jgi:hypothetical protein
MNDPEMPDEPPYDGTDDFAKSLLVAYEAVLARPRQSQHKRRCTTRCDL